MKRAGLIASVLAFAVVCTLWAVPAKAEWGPGHPTRPKPPPHFTANWQAVARCESGLRWHIAGTYLGGLQFSYPTWRSNGGGWWDGHGGFSFRVRVQKRVAERLKSRRGMSPWPYCGRFG